MNIWDEKTSILRMEQRKNKNADDTKQIRDVTKQKKRRQETCEDDINNEEKKKFKRERHEAECRRYEVEEKKTEGACGYLSIPILLILNSL
ncbi:hypothetical protein T11_11103 [Trichinella zimbabwensis]|uniref:Uncharacterized protein n=1 Tax=Trichinella zimbabwensis TaxID=268475 RepID=A0A0V1GS73_9BILA|nr:hypothetical protein T11_11103 [Trichinella zimbabwensis]